MRQNIVNQLVQLCSQVNVDLQAVETFINEYNLCGYEISRAATRLADKHCLEYGMLR